MRALGTEVVMVPQAEGSTPGRVSGTDIELAQRKAEAIVAERGAFYLDQFNRAQRQLSLNDL